MERWQIVVGLFFLLLPVVLMLDFWGNERLTFRGQPLPRPWQRQVEHGHTDEEH
jgi:hypothetical protein